MATTEKKQVTPYDTLRRVLDYPRYDDVRARASESAELKVEGVQCAMVECKLLLLHMYVVCCMAAFIFIVHVCTNFTFTAIPY